MQLLGVHFALSTHKLKKRGKVGTMASSASILKKKAFWGIVIQYQFGGASHDPVAKAKLPQCEH